MRIVTWNCCRGPFDAKAQALARLKPDIAILTETARPKAGDTSQRLWFGGSKGTGIVALAYNDFALEREPANRASGSDPVRAMRVRGPVSFHLMAVWGRQNTDYIRGVYDRVADQREFAERCPTVLAGDLNSNTIWDRPRARPYHIDYCFVPRAWGRGIRRVTIGGYEAWKRWSDHRPVMVDVEVTA